MKLTEQEVRYVADLGNLRLSDEEIAKFRGDLDEILTHIEKLNELDTSAVEPMAQVLYEAGETATLRDDVARSTIPNAAQAGGGYFKVPKVIER